MKSQKTATIHQIGKLIAARRRFYSHSDLHSGTDQGFSDLAWLSVYSNCDSCYILSQATILEIMFDRYGNMGEEKKITTDDKVRVAGILITDSEMREFIPAMTGTAQSGDRQSLDASRSRKLAGMRYLFNKFIDAEVTVTIPMKWFDPLTRISINNHLGEGVFEEHGNFNPNNPQQILLAWTEKDVAAIYAKVNKEYKQAMDRYTQGTGGGPGADENFAAWEQRCETNVVTYTQGSQPSLIYLSVVHMWDKQYDFPFVTVKDPMPADVCIDDCFDFSTNDVPFLDTPENSGVGSSSHRTTSSQNDNARSSRKEKAGGLGDVVKSLNAFNKDGTTQNREIIDLVKQSLTKNSQTINLQPHELTKHIADTQRLLTEYEDKVEAQRAKRKAIQSGDGTEEKKQKKIKLLTSEIKNHKKMISTLRGTIDHQRDLLKAATKKGGDGSLDASMDASSDESDDSVNSDDS